MSPHQVVIYAELSGDFPLGDSRQPTYKSLRPF
ncbi:MFS transporter, partial [Acinetobacter pittii]